MRILRKVRLKEDAARRLPGMSIIDLESLRVEAAIHGSGGVFHYFSPPRMGKRKTRKTRKRRS